MDSPLPTFLRFSRGSPAGDSLGSPGFRDSQARLGGAPLGRMIHEGCRENESKLFLARTSGDFHGAARPHRASGASDNPLRMERIVRTKPEAMRDS